MSNGLHRRVCSGDDRLVLNELLRFDRALLFEINVGLIGGVGRAEVKKTDPGDEFLVVTGPFEILVE